MAKAPYDPQKAHAYYERTKNLKGRHAESSLPKAPPKTGPVGFGAESKPATPAEKQAAVAKVGRLKEKVSTLEGALTKANAALSAKRAAAAKEAKKSSDGKTTAKERQSAKEYRESHREELKTKEADRRKSTSSSSSGSSSTTSVSSMSADQLETRVTNIKKALVSARAQLATATRALGQLAHSALASELDLDAQMLHPPISRKESVKMTADFGGYATRTDVQCADGRTILPGAFDGDDGQVVPLVWQHGHNDVNNILGHCVLEKRPDGTYAHAYFNETAAGQNAKMQVKHGDIKFLSIFANNLRETIKDRVNNLKEVMHGNIREVSLVLAGANPGAYIDYVNITHSDGEVVLGEDAVITTGLEIDLEIAHADSSVSTKDDSRTIQDILDTLDEEQSDAVNYLLSQALTGASTAAHSDPDNGEAVGAEGTNTETGDQTGDGTENGETGDDEGGQDTTPAQGVEAGTEAGAAADAAPVDAGDGTDTGTPTGPEAGGEVQHGNTTSQEDNSMTHNVFDRNQGGLAVGTRPTATLQHGDTSMEDALRSIVKDAKKNGSLKDAIENYIEHTGVMVDGTLQHGIENINYLFPDAKTLENSPAFISRRMEWVDKVLGGVRKSPFSRIKTLTADITPDEARARGYITGNLKNEEFFALSKRETTPQTIYKKQKLDRDDVLDITDLDVVAWLKAEMKVMLDEELAGAILVGDGRSIGDEDKIKETNIRPVASDAELYVTTVNVNLDDASSSIEELVDAAISHRRYYKGTGTPTFYTTESTIAAFLTVKDNFGRRIYSTLGDIAAVLRCSEVVAVEVMERVPDLVGIMVNLADYTLGADRGGQATMFDDFDIDYNKLIYLIETRCSGALTTPKAALVFRKVAGSSTMVTPTAPARAANTVTVPTVTGVTYKDQDGNTLVTGTPVVLDEDDTPMLHVTAYPASGKYFADNANDEWEYTFDADA